jgi:hypothetical protein
MNAKNCNRNAGVDKKFRFIAIADLDVKVLLFSSNSGSADVIMFLG